MNHSKRAPHVPENYDLFFKFIDYYAPAGFQGINPRDGLMLELEQLMERNNQFFFFGDLLQMKIFYTSKLSASLFGIDQDEFTPYHLFEATHPDDLHRFTLAKTKLFKMAEELFIAEGGHFIISTNFRMRNSKGNYVNTLVQSYMFYASMPHKTIFKFQVNTPIDGYKKLLHSNHYYVGTDLSYFTFPDEKLLETGNIFTKREFEIIKLLDSGLKSAMIAEKLFLSIHTVNTHRRAMLKKSGKASTSELIFELKEQGQL